MQCSSDVQIPDGILAANALLAENSRQGFGASTHTLYQGFEVAISSTALGIPGTLYDGRVRCRYTGKERDAESGLDYFGARYYASNMGRWMSPDWADKPEAVPYSDLANPQSLNLYGYVNNNPLSKADPDGHCPQCMVWAEQAAEEVESSPAGQAAVNWLGAAATATTIWAFGMGSKAVDVVTSANWSNFNYSSSDPIPMSRPTSASTPAPSSSTPSNTASPNGPSGGLPKPPTGKGSVPPDQRDPKRVSTSAEKDQQLAKQGGKCANCGETVKPGEGIGHHVERHADGGKTNSTNVPVVCKDCHKDLHTPN